MTPEVHGWLTLLGTNNGWCPHVYTRYNRAHIFNRLPNFGEKCIMIALKYTRAKAQGMSHFFFYFLTKKYVLLEKIPYVCNACHIIYVPGNDLVFLCVFLGSHRTLCTLQISHLMCTNDFRNVQWYFSKISFHLWYFDIRNHYLFNLETIIVSIPRISPVTFHCTISTAWVVSFTAKASSQDGSTEGK